MYIHVKALTRQKKEYVKELKKGYFEVSIREKAENNMANKRILEILKEYFGKSNISIVNGHKSPSKLFGFGDLFLSLKFKFVFFLSKQ